MKIREAINKIFTEEQFISEEINVNVDTFMGSPMRNKRDNLINEVENLTINDVGNNLIKKVANMTIYNSVNCLIVCIVDMTINYARKNLKQENASDAQIQFSDDPAGKLTNIY